MPNQWCGSLVDAPGKTFVLDTNFNFNFFSLVAGNGEKKRFWEDVWAGDRPFNRTFPRPYDV